MIRAEAEAIAAQGGEAVVAVLLSMAERIEELERRLGQNSSNSSMPPSTDPPMTRQQRRALARERAKKSLRKPGGQPGHEGKHRQMAPPEKVDETFECLPDACSGCGLVFTGDEAQAGEPVVHQKWELPPISPLIFEYRLHRVCCPGCAKKTLAGLPAGVSASAFGPRLEAHIAMLAGVYRLSRRQVAQVVEEILGCPISTGAVDTAIMRMSRVLADPWQALAEAIRQADVVHADETSWRLAGAQQWLWLGAAALVACYRIDPHRSQAAAKKLLGEDFGGILISDRYAGYHFLDVLQQQLCWCHAIRQLVEISERQGAPGKLGAKLVKAAREVIAVHHRYLQEQRTLPWLARDSPRCEIASRRCCKKANAAAIRRPQTSALDCSRSTRRSGPSARYPASARRTTAPSERSATP